MNEECADVIQSYEAANLAITGELTDLFAKCGGLTLGLISVPEPLAPRFPLALM